MERRRGLAAVAVGTVLLFVAAAALMPKTFPFRRGSGATRFLSPDGSVVTDAALIALALITVAAAVMMQIFARKGSDSPPLSRRRPVWTQIVILLLVLWGTALVASLFDRDSDDARRPAPEATGPPGGAEGEPAQPESSQALGLLVTTGLVLVVAGSGTLLYLLSRQDRARRQASQEATGLVRQLQAAAREVEEATDPRSAVIACFERLELTLLQAGAARRASDTPFELVERALLQLDVPEVAARRLTSLYELARFSPHEVDGSMRNDAVGAFETIAAHLEGTT